MVFKNLFILLLWRKVALAIDGLIDWFLDRLIDDLIGSTSSNIPWVWENDINIVSPNRISFYSESWSTQSIETGRWFFLSPWGSSFLSVNIYISRRVFPGPCWGWKHGIATKNILATGAPWRVSMVTAVATAAIDAAATLRESRYSFVISYWKYYSSAGRPGWHAGQVGEKAH